MSLCRRTLCAAARAATWAAVAQHSSHHSPAASRHLRTLASPAAAATAVGAARTLLNSSSSSGSSYGCGGPLQHQVQLHRQLHQTRVFRVDEDINDESEFTEAGQDSIPSERVEQLVEQLVNLTVIEASQLNKLLKKRLGLPDMPMGGGMMMPMGGMPMGGVAPAADEAAEVEEKKEEQTEFDVKLQKVDPAGKIKVIKEVRAATGLGLKEAKELVEGAPCVIKKALPKAEAEELASKLKEVGGECSVE